MHIGPGGTRDGNGRPCAARVPDDIVRDIRTIRDFEEHARAEVIVDPIVGERDALAADIAPQPGPVVVVRVVVVDDGIGELHELDPAAFPRKPLLDLRSRNALGDFLVQLVDDIS